MKTLTKSRFKLASDCPSKLNYTGKDKEYANQKSDDSFLQALAEGGHQVGELSKCYYPGGHDIEELDYETALQKTNALLELEDVVIFEAAIKYNDFFIRVDVLEKIGNKVNLIEVKAKSYDGSDEGFLNKGGFIDSGWKSYLEDVAFQKYVMQKAFPRWDVRAYLMMADKSKKSTVNGLNQRFQIIRKNGRPDVKIVGDTTLDGLGEPILSCVNVDAFTDMILSDKAFKDEAEMLFEDKINYWAQHYKNDKKIITQVSPACFKCEYQGDDPKLKSGLKECWKQFYAWTDEQFQRPKTTDVWNYRAKKKLFVEEDIIFMDQLDESRFGDLVPNSDGTMSSSERQWMQVDKVQRGDGSFYLDKEGMKDLMDSFVYPLHFIDFETSMVAIPFYEGQHPYEQVAFQFSHHIMHEDGKVEHIGEFIEMNKGNFPNFDFLRALRKELDNDEGTIFRYAPHENTVLNQIERQLLASEEVDVDELIAFIHSITHLKDNRVGERDMVDMWAMVKKYYYDPSMKGSNSIKAVLPAVLKSSAFIQDKYAKPIYGKTSPMKSLNFEDGWIWIKKDEEGNVLSPYKLLPPIFEDIDQDIAEEFTTENHLADGGSAMVAFAKIQFTNISEEERNAIIKGLLKYCELDTLAMVMIYEFWMNVVGEV